MTGEDWSPLGQAMLDYMGGELLTQITVRSTVETDREVMLSAFFREGNRFPKTERLALKNCRGRVLDIGAGAGPHSLYLQNKGFDITAIDINREATEVMRMRGIKNVLCSDIFSFTAPPFDTIILLMNGIGIGGDLKHLERLLEYLKRLLKPNGQILFDSTDISYVREEDQAAASLKMPEPEYYGSVWYQLVYKGRQAEPYPWLFVDRNTVHSVAEQLGYKMSILGEDGDQYLARLSL